MWSALFGGGSGGVVERAEDLKKGRAHVKGRVVTTTPLLSPLNARECAAFYYRATYQAPSRLKGYVRRRLRDALVYAEGLTLEVGDARIALTPDQNEPFTRDDHKALKAAGVDGFDAREQVIRVGGEVVVTGKLKRDGEAWSMKVQAIEVTAEEQERVEKAKAKKAPPAAKRGPPKPKRGGKRKR